MKETKMNKQKAVLKHLKEYGNITSMEAFNLYGATRLSAIIFCLRQKGYNIYVVNQKCKDMYGSTCRFAKYILSDEEN